MNSTHNESKSVVAERSIKNLMVKFIKKTAFNSTFYPD